LIYRGNIVKTIAMQLCAFALGLSYAHSATLVTYDVPTSNTTSFSVPSVVSISGLSAAALSKGSGLTLSSSSSGWRATGYDQTAQTATAISAASAGGDFWSFAITAAANYKVTMNGFGALGFVGSSTGPKSWALISSADSSFASFSTVASSDVSTGTANYNTPISVATSWSSALAAAPIVINSGVTQYFRIVGYGASGTTGTGGIGNVGTVDMSVLGDVESLARQVVWSGGNGTWNTSASNWTEGGTATTFAAGNDASFTSGGSINLDAGGINAGAVTISGANNTFFAGGPLNATGISKSGVGELSLGVAGTYTSGINVDGGSVTTTVNNALGGTVSLNAGTSLNIGSTTNNVESLSVNDAAINGTGKINVATSASVTVSAGTSTLNAEVSGTGSLTKAGAGTLILAAANSYTGDTVVVSGILETAGSERISDQSVLKPGTGATFRLGGNESVGGLGSTATSSTIDIGANNLTIGFNTSSNSFSGNLTGSGSVTKLGAGTQTFGTNNSWTGGFVLKEGNVRIIGNGALTNNQMQTHALGKGTLTLEGGTIQSSTAGTDLSTTTGRTLYNNVNLNGGFTSGATGEVGRIAISTNAGGSTVISKNSTLNTFGNLQWYQSMDGAAFRITKTGAATLELLNANTIDGVNLQGGSLGYGHVNALGSGTVNLGGGTAFGQSTNIGTTVGDRTVANNLNVQGNVTLGLGTYSNYLSGAVDLTGANRTVTLGNSTDLSGQISNGGLTVASTNATRSLNLTAANSYNGGTTVSGGTLLVNNTTGSGTGSGAVTVSFGASLGGSGTIAGATTVAGTLRPGNSPGVLTFGSDLTLNTGANLVWELWANTEVNSPVTFDQVVVGGNLLFGGANGVTLDFGTSLGGSMVSWGDTFWDSQRSWILFDVTGTTSGIEQLSIANTVFADAAGTSLSTARAGASFSISQVGSDVVVNYIPEPTSSSMILLGLSGLIGVRAFRRKV
jgi:autotransporter-associated beta strand protein